MPKYNMPVSKNRKRKKQRSNNDALVKKHGQRKAAGLSRARSSGRKS